MDETMNEAVVNETMDVEESFDAGVTDEELDSMWADDSDFADESEAFEVDADQQSNEGSETETPEVEADTDQYLELKHFDEVRKVNKEEAKALAQKGMDYDRVRGKLSEADSRIKQLEKYESFLNTMKGDFDTVDEMILSTNAQILADREGISYEQAMNRLSADQQKAEQMPVDISEEMRKQSLAVFLQEYPDVKAADIPQEVWDDMQRTNSLVASYAKYERKQLIEKNKVLEQNAKNRSRSTGSMTSNGNKTYSDDIDRMWYEDDW